MTMIHQLLHGLVGTREAYKIYLPTCETKNGQPVPPRRGLGVGAGLAYIPRSGLGPPIMKLAAIGCAVGRPEI